MRLSFTQSGFISNTLLTCLFAFACFFTNDSLAQNCPPPNPGFIVVNDVTNTTAFINWVDISVTDSFVVEYGPEGFPAGTGVMVGTLGSSVTIDGLNPCVTYTAYIYSVCGVDDLSDPVSTDPFTTTTDVAVCTYTFDLQDTWGDGWNNAFITVNHNGEEINYTLDYANGYQGTFELEALTSLPVCVSYTPGFFEDEVSFSIIDPNGTTIYADGPFPETGEILNFVACGSPCAAPKNWEMGDVNATNATTVWEFLPGYDGSVFLEYGPVGFTRGTWHTGNSACGGGFIYLDWAAGKDLVQCLSRCGLRGRIPAK